MRQIVHFFIGENPNCAKLAADSEGIRVHSRQLQHGLASGTDVPIAR